MDETAWMRQRAACVLRAWVSRVGGGDLSQKRLHEKPKACEHLRCYFFSSRRRRSPSRTRAARADQPYSILNIWRSTLCGAAPHAALKVTQHASSTAIRSSHPRCACQISAPSFTAKPALETCAKTHEKRQRVCERPATRPTPNALGSSRGWSNRPNLQYFCQDESAFYSDITARRVSRVGRCGE